MKDTNCFRNQVSFTHNKLVRKDWIADCATYDNVFVDLIEIQE